MLFQTCTFIAGAGGGSKAIATPSSSGAESSSASSVRSVQTVAIFGCERWEMNIPSGSTTIQRRSCWMPRSVQRAEVSSMPLSPFTG